MVQKVNGLHEEGRDILAIRLPANVSFAAASYIKQDPSSALFAIR